MNKSKAVFDRRKALVFALIAVMMASMFFTAAPMGAYGEEGGTPPAGSETAIPAEDSEAPGDENGGGAGEDPGLPPEETPTEEEGGGDVLTPDPDPDQESDTDTDPVADPEPVLPAPEETAAAEKTAEDLPGMPARFALSEKQRREKSDIVKEGVPAAFKEMKIGIDYIADEIIFTADTEEEAAVIAEAYGVELVGYEAGLGVASLERSDASVEDLVLVGADAQNNFPAVSPNLIYKALYTYNDPYLKQYTDAAYTTIDPNYQWHHEAINTEVAWDTTTGDPRVKVLVLDSGLKKAHVEFTSKATVTAVGPGASGALPDGEEPWTNPPSPTTDPEGHGTHVTGIIGAAAGNGTLGAGIAPGVTLTTYKIADTDTPDASGEIDFNSAMLYAGIQYAIDNHYNIVNMSLGGYYVGAYEKTKMKEARESGIALIAASGNDGTNINMYPASYSQDMIVVGASDRNGARASFSNTSSYLDLAAPGVGIWSADAANNSAYVTKDGTSMATPIVSAVAALVLSEYSKPAGAFALGDLNGDGKMTIADVRQLEKMLKASVNAGTTSGLGAGIIDASKAVGGAPSLPQVAYSGVTRPAGAAATSTVFKVGPGGTFALSVTPNVSDKIYYTLDGKTPTVANGTLYNPLAPTLGTPVPIATTPGKQTIKAISVNGQGKASKVATFTYTTQQPVTGIALTGAPVTSTYGVSLTLKATTSATPVSLAPTNKAVTWSWSDGSLTTPYPGFTLTAAGKLTIPKSANTALTTITVRATASDKYGYATNFNISLSNNPAGVTVSGQNTLGIGKSTTLKATVLPANTPADKKKVTWSFVSPANATDFATLNPTSGKLTAKSLNGGAATAVQIRATTNTGGLISDPFTVTLYDGLVDKIQLPASKVTLFTTAGTDSSPTSYNLKGTDPSTGKAFAVTSKKALFSDALTWTSSKPAVATVSAAGVVSAVAPGTTVVKAAATDGSGKTASVTITVKIPVVSIAASLPAMGGRLAPKATKASLTPTALVNAGDPAATSKTLSWEFVSPANAADLATLNAKTGKLTAKATVAVDTAVQIRARSVQNPNVVSGTLAVTLVPAASTISFSAAVSGKTLDFFTVTGTNYTAHPKEQTNAANRTVTATGILYTSSNPAIAGVDANGKVTALKAGTVTITATAADYSGKKASYKARVRVPASSITILPKVASVYDGSKSIAMGKTGAFTGKSGTAFGKPSVTKLKWTVEYDPAGYFSPTQWDENKKYISVSSSGVVSVKKQNWYNYSFLVQAATTDGSTLSATYLVYVDQSNSAIKFNKKPSGWDSVGGEAWYIDFSTKFPEPTEAHEDFTVTTSGGKLSVYPIGAALDTTKVNPDAKDNTWYCAYFGVVSSTITGTKANPQTFTVTVTCNTSGTKATVKFYAYRIGSLSYIAL